MRSFFSNMRLGILAVILAAGILLISVSFLMYGAATALGTVFVAQPWLGWVITGGVFLLGPIIFFKIHFSKIKKSPSDFSDLSNKSEVLIHTIIDATQKYPYQSTGAAAAMGFIAAGKETSPITDILKDVLLPLLVEHLQPKQKLS